MTIFRQSLHDGEKVKRTCSPARFAIHFILCLYLFCIHIIKRWISGIIKNKINFPQYNLMWKCPCLVNYCNTGNACIWLLRGRQYNKDGSLQLEYPIFVEPFISFLVYFIIFIYLYADCIKYPTKTTKIFSIYMAHKIPSRPFYPSTSFPLPFHSNLWRKFPKWINKFWANKKINVLVGGVVEYYLGYEFYCQKARLDISTLLPSITFNYYVWQDN